jgi:hypothetical protein
LLAVFATRGISCGLLRRSAAGLLARLAGGAPLLALRPLAGCLLGRILLACFRHRFFT